MLADRHTRNALQRLSTAGTGARNAGASRTVSSLLRAQATAARQRVLADLSGYLQTFEDCVIGKGVSVYWAASAQQANRVVVERLQAADEVAVHRNHAPLLDEIGLDQALAANGISLTRLHPGDRILELAGQRPAHPVLPAIHLRVEDVSAAMQAHWRIPPSLDPDLLASTLRVRLRRTLPNVRTAILGLQFAVADSGTMICFDSDGHSLSLLTLADRAICLLSVEQIAANADDADVLMASFAQAAWGQALPTYIAEFVGPFAAGEGPVAVDLVLVDNGRSRLLAEGFGEALRCIQCGACHAVCPVFQRVGGEPYGGSAFTGPIGSVVNPILLRPDLGHDQPYLSSACGACAPVCPVGIDLPGLLSEQRGRSAAHASWRERVIFWLWQRLLARPRLFQASLRLAYRLRTRRQQGAHGIRA